MNFRFQIYLLVLCISFHANAQNPTPKFKYLGVNDGLSQGHVECIIQDNEDYLWFGTHYGLNKYNGYEITVYKNDRHDPGSISNNNIVCLYQDSKNNLWIGTLNGLNKYDRANEKFISYKHDSKNSKSIGGNGIKSITEDRQGNLWISTVDLRTNIGSLNLYDNKNGFTTYNIKGLAATDNINCFFTDSKGVLWLGLTNGLSYYDKKNKAFITYQPQAGSNKTIKGKSVNAIVEDYSGNLWIATQEGGVTVLNTKAKTFKHYIHSDNDPLSLGSNEVYTLLLDKAGRIWVGGGSGGLHLYNPLQDNFTHYENIEHDPNSISHNSVQTLYQDKSGLIWVGMHKNGINFFSPQEENFKHYKRESKVGGLSHNNVKAFCEDKQGNIWIGTDGGGLNKFDRDKNIFYAYKHTSDSKSIGSDAILDIFEDSYNNLWISIWDGGLNLLDKKTFTYKHYYHNPDNIHSLSSNNIACAVEDTSGNLWVASYSEGLNLFNRRNENFIRIPLLLNNQKSRVSCLMLDKEGLIWIGTNSNGVGVFDPHKRKIVKHFQYDENKQSSLSSNGVYSLFVDSKNRIWTGTDKGINLYSIAKNGTVSWNKIKALAADVVLGITQDAKGNLWLSTLNGIVKFNPESKIISRFSIADGLQGTEFIQNACMKTKNGEMFFGGLNGFNIFHPDSLKKNTYIPPVYFTDFQIFNKSIKVGENSPLKQPIDQTKEIILSYKQSVISFEFAALNFIRTEKNQYAYKLEGFDNDWNYIGTKRSITYTNLDPDEYTLKVKACNNDGIWNEEGTSIKLIINPPFWKTWWAYLFYSLVFISFLYLFRKYSIIQVKVMNKLIIERLENKKIAEITEAKMRFFTNISHEIRTPLTLISSPLESVITEDALTPISRKNLSSVRKNVNRLLDLANQILQFRKLDQGYLHLNASETPVVSFIHEILEYFEQQAVLKNITIHIKNETNEDVHLWLDRDMITTVLYNLIANALKFTESGGNITIRIFEGTLLKTTWFDTLKKLLSVKDNRNSIAIEVMDSGKGIPIKELKNIFQRFYQVHDDNSQQSPGSGIGLSLVKEYVELHKGQIEVKSKLHHGTSFIIHLPKDLKIENINARRSDVVIDNLDASIEVQEDVTDNGNDSNELPLILIVEDDEELVDHLRELLTKSFKVETANNGKSGLEKALSVLPDLIISDVAMPEMDGFELCKTLKSNITTSHIPIILLTAKASEENIVHGYNLGADAYIPKPFNIKVVESQGRSLIRSREILREKYKNMILIEPSDIEVNSPDEEFLKQLMEITEANIMNSTFDVPTLATEIGMGHSTLLRKVKSLTGLSLVELIKSTRLKRAAMIFRKEKYTVSDVCYMVGFTDPRYFSRCFTKEFGKTPSEYLNDQISLRMKDKL